MPVVQAAPVIRSNVKEGDASLYLLLFSEVSYGRYSKVKCSKYSFSVGDEISDRLRRNTQLREVNKSFERMKALDEKGLINYKKRIVPNFTLNGLRVAPQCAVYHQKMCELQLMVLFANTESHKMVKTAMDVLKKNGIRVEKLHSSSAAALNILLAERIG